MSAKVVQENGRNFNHSDGGFGLSLNVFRKTDRERKGRNTQKPAEEERERKRDAEQKKEARVGPFCAAARPRRLPSTTSRVSAQLALKLRRTRVQLVVSSRLEACRPFFYFCFNVLAVSFALMGAK